MRKLVVVAVLSLAFAACSSDENANNEDDMGGDSANNVNNTNNVNNSNNANNSNNLNNSNNSNNTNNSNNANNTNNTNNAVDMGTDMLADQGADMAAGEGCADGYTSYPGISADVVACEGALGTLNNQCDAGNACGTGWHMCTGTEYRALYETEGHPRTEEATFWLAACVRDGADPTAPVDGVCADCTGTQSGGTRDVGFSCVNNITLVADQLYVGVRAGSACSFVGLAENGNDAFWSPLSASSTEAGAICCRD